MTDLFSNTDGANGQARAVLSYLQKHDGLENSWLENRYQAEPQVHRWHNCREQGYVVVLRSLDRRKQVNIAFFEHRNSDNICAVEWEQFTLNPPTIETAKFGEVYKDKYDTSHSVNQGKADEMSKWIYDRLEYFWSKTNEKPL